MRLPYTFNTVDIETGDGNDLIPAHALYLAEQHAQEGTRLLNEYSLGKNANSGSQHVPARDTAAVHAQLAVAYAAIAQARLT